MSGSAALASARRRRAIPQKPENEIVETPKQQLTQPMPQQPIAANPTALLIKHNGLLGGIQNDIENLKKQLTDIKVPNTSNVDEKSTLEFYKSQHSILLEEMREVKKTLLKVQTFAMETNLELMKLKRNLKPVENVELPNQLEEE
jgi:hypothetical protein